MADKKISELTEVTTLPDTALVTAVDLLRAASDQNVKITKANFKTVLDQTIQQVLTKGDEIDSEQPLTFKTSDANINTEISSTASTGFKILRQDNSLFISGGLNLLESSTQLNYSDFPKVTYFDVATNVIQIASYTFASGSQEKNTAFIGLEYLEDYSDNFIGRSIPDVAWVNEQIASSGGETATDGGAFTGALALDNTVSTYYDSYDLSVSGSILFSIGVDAVIGGYDNFKIISDGVTPVASLININDTFKGRTNLPTNGILPEGEYQLHFWKQNSGISLSVETLFSQADSPLFISDIQFYLASENITETDGSEIVSWSDSSINANPAVGTTGTTPFAQTAGGFKVARFNGTDEIMKIEGLTDLSGTNVDASFFVVCKIDEPIASDIDRYPFALDSGISNNSNNLNPVVYKENLEINTRKANSTAGANNIFNSYYTNQIDVWVVNKKGTLLDVYRNGRKEVSDFDVTGLVTGSNITVGGIITQLNNSGEKFFKGDIYEVGAYSKQLIQTEVDYLNELFATKYSLTLLSDYEPMWVDNTDLVYAFEADQIQSTVLSNPDNIYPLSQSNLLSVNKIITSAGVSFENVLNKKAFVFDGTQNRISSVFSVIPTGGDIDKPFTLFYVGEFTSNAVLQSVFGLGNINSVNNNLGLIGRSAANDLRFYRRVNGVVTTNNNLGAIDNNRHVICMNLKLGGLMDVWVDGVKTQSDVNMTAGITLNSENWIFLGNNQNNTEPFTGKVELGHVYDNSLSDVLIGQTFTKINTRLSVY